MKQREYKAKTQVRMSCGHWQWFSAANSLPSPGDYMFCMQCMSETHCPYPLDKDVDGNLVLGEWRWTCISKNCRMGRKCGASQSEAVRQASRHGQQRPHHDIHVIGPNGVISHRIGRDQNALPLFHVKRSDPQPIPF